MAGGAWGRVGNSPRVATWVAPHGRASERNHGDPQRHLLRVCPSVSSELKLLLHAQEGQRGEHTPWHG
ncbi:hypothetical protein GUJ93_ZPchr0003g17516 [Zizania palustris]|uniref:Uncharacterized protein n=1 Tax=Zizania palustris TaxID=103762 RepID=A0A8J5RXQ3_ZIZPA|nr:hypothetical protein GUJ93_ZPchr0003g17516 [Zizania palustris]